MYSIELYIYSILLFPKKNFPQGHLMHNVAFHLVACGYFRERGVGKRDQKARILYCNSAAN